VNQDSNLPVPTSELLETAKLILPQEELDQAAKYLAAGGHQLSPDTAMRFFQLFLNGSDCKEIHRINKVFPYEAILLARVKFRWDEERDSYIMKLQTTIRDKVMKAQLETTDLMTDILVAAKKKHGDKIKKYLQSGDEEDLKGAFSVDTIHSLMKLSESLLKITGQDKNIKVTTENKNSFNLSVSSGGTGGPGNLSPDDAAEILRIIAESKRKVKSEPTKN